MGYLQLIFEGNARVVIRLGCAHPHHANDYDYKHGEKQN
jgi:hypothetical protein